MAAFHVDEGDATLLEGEAQLRLRRPVEVVPAAFVIANGAPRHA